MATGRLTLDEARRLGAEIGINWATSPFDAQPFWQGLEVELEHGSRDPQTNVTNDDPIMRRRRLPGRN